MKHPLIAGATNFLSNDPVLPFYCDPLPPCIPEATLVAMLVFSPSFSLPVYPAGETGITK